MEGISTFQPCSYHAQAIIAVQLLYFISYHPYEQAGVEGIRCGRVDLNDVWKRSAAVLRGAGLGV